MSELTPKQVADFLTANPTFLLDNPSVLAQLQLQHQDNHVPSLALRAQQQLRIENQQLKNQLQQLATQAKQNEHIYRVFSDCQHHLMAQTSVSELTQKIEQHLSQAFNVSQCKLLKYQSDYDDILTHRLKDANHYLGRLSVQEQQLLFNDNCQSAAIYLIGEPNSPLALLAFASDDELHFEPSQDSFFIFEFIKALQARLANE